MSINRTNETRIFEISSSIVEWDIKRAGIHLIKEYDLLPEKDIKYYESLPKKESDVAIGKRQIDDKEFSKRFNQSFTDAMNLFLQENDLDEDIDILSIKKDACFVINKDIKKPDIGSYIHFIPKNRYHAYMYLKPFLKKGKGYEFYFGKDDLIDVKGLSSNKAKRDQLLALHKDGMLNFLLCVVDLAEKSGMDMNQLSNFLHDFVLMYKKKELDYDYYREFNPESKFRYRFLGSEMLTGNIDESMLEKIQIEYNYIYLILPLINLII